MIYNGAKAESLWQINSEVYSEKNEVSNSKPVHHIYFSTLLS